MALNFNTLSGLVDLPDAALAAGEVAAGYLLGPISRNAQFGATIPEVFYGEYYHDDTVALPISTIDGYAYSRDELVYIWEQRSTLNQMSMASGAGELLLCAPWVDPATGKINVHTSYYVQGGAQTNTNDGIIAVWTLAIRRRGNLSLTAPLTFTDIADSAFNQDVALKTTNLRNLNRNAKLAAVRCEIFSKSDTLDAQGFPAGYSNGQTVPLPTSSVDGYVYSRSELTYLPFWIYTGKSNRAGSTGPGRIRFLQISVNASTGLVSTQVNYWNGSTETVTQDGIVGVVVVACRAIGTMAAQAAAFTEVSDELLMAGKVCGDTPMKAVNKNAKFSILRPEAFIASYTNGQQVPLPTSPVDGYTYARTELRYLSALQASTVTGAKGAIQVLIHGVNPATGIVSTRLDYNNNGQNRQQTTEGQLRVLTLAYRSHETADLETTPTPPEPPPAPDPPTWVEFSGENGTFYFELSIPDDQRELVFHQIQLASDAGFTTLLRYVDLGRALQKTLRMTRVTRYARARSRFSAGDWSAWAVYGAPTAVWSGHPVDNTIPGGYNPANPFIDQMPDSSVYARPHSTALTDGDVDLAKSGVVGKAVEMVRNPNFESGNRDWTKVGGVEIINDPTNAYDGNWVARIIDANTAGVYNSIFIPVQAGDTLMATCMAKRTAGDGQAFVRINWWNSAKVFISSSDGNSITSASYTTSRVVGAAPANAFFATVSGILKYQTVSTTVFFDQFNISLTPKDLDDVGDSTTYARTTPNQRDGGGRGYNALDTLYKLTTGTPNKTSSEIETGVGRASAAIDGSNILNATALDWQRGYTNKPQDLHNLVLTPTGDSGSQTSWDGGVTVVAVSGQDWIYALKFIVRDTYEDNNWFPVRAGDKYFIAGWLSGLNANYAVSLGLNSQDSGGGDSWSSGGTVGAGVDWTYVSEWVTVPAGKIKARPWLQINGFNNFGYGLATRLFIGRYEIGAEITTGKSVDILSDGTTYGRPKLTALTAGEVDLSKAGVISKTLQYVTDYAGGDRYARTAQQGTGGDRGYNALDTLYKLTTGTPNKTSSEIETGVGRASAAIDSGNVVVAAGLDFSRAYTGKNVDNVPDGSTRMGPTITRMNAATDTSGNLKLKNIAKATPTTSSPTTTSDTYVDMPEMSVTVTTQGNKILIVFSATCSQNAANAGGRFQLLRETTILLTDYGFITPVATSVFGVGFSWSDAPAAGTYTYKIQWARGTAAGTLGSSGLYRNLQVTELG